MVLSGLSFDEWPPEANILAQFSLPRSVKPLGHDLFSAFAAPAGLKKGKGKKPRVICPPGKDQCYCAEGHKCIQSWPWGHEANGEDFVEYIEGCPGKPQGMEWIARDHFNKKNPLCEKEKCTCVLENEPNSDAPEFAEIPSGKGEWRTLKRRYEMPKALTERFVNAVRGGEEEDERPPKEPNWLTADEFKKEYPHVKKNMNRIMRAMHRKVIAIESMIEEPEPPGTEGRRDPTLGPQPPPIAVPPELPAQNAADDQGERSATLLMTEFRKFQEVCKRLQAGAQALGMANNGEGGLNCFDDYKERQRMEDTLDTIKTIKQTGAPGKAQFLNTLKMPMKDHANNNLLIVMGIIRDMGPNDSNAAWLPRARDKDAPILPAKAKAKPAEEEDKSTEESTEQRMPFDPLAAAALAGWLSARSPHARAHRTSRHGDFLGTVPCESK